MTFSFLSQYIGSDTKQIKFGMKKKKEQTKTKIKIEELNCRYTGLVNSKRGETTANYRHVKLGHCYFNLVLFKKLKLSHAI
jgi:hypothetical protein